MALVLVPVLTLPREYKYLLLAAGIVFLALFDYSVAMPNSGEPGKRRKIALGKLKEMFGSSWMPEPEARPL